MFVTTLDGIANPMPAAAPPSCGSAAASVGMPITAPRMSVSAPPELPGLIGALVWIAFGSTTPFPSGSARLSALTMPSVKLEESPSGLPIAIAMSPIRSLSEFANFAGLSPAPSTLITARSSGAKTPTSLAVRRLPSRWSP